MALITTREMFAKALNDDYAIGAFNVNNMEIIQGIVDAAKEEQAPLILQVSAGARKYARPAYLINLVKAAAEDSGLDLVLHLDHGEDFDICKKCVDDGFTSVMIDGSKHPFEENIRITKEVVEYAHAHGVVVEAELGRLAGRCRSGRCPLRHVYRSGRSCGIRRKNRCGLSGHCHRNQPRCL